jgi:hypothetical protein
MRTALHLTRSSRTQLGVSINVWRLAGDILIITCNFLCCNHQVRRDLLISLYILSVYVDRCKLSIPFAVIHANNYICPHNVCWYFLFPIFSIHFASFISACQSLFPSDIGVDTSWLQDMRLSRKYDWRLQPNKYL